MSLSPGLRLEGRKLLAKLGPAQHPTHLLMDRAYEGDETRTLAIDLGYDTVVPPKHSRKAPWTYVINSFTNSVIRQSVCFVV